MCTICRMLKKTIGNISLFRCTFMSVMLLCASPFIHMVLSPYIKLFCVWGTGLIATEAVEKCGKRRNRTREGKTFAVSGNQMEGSVRKELRSDGRMTATRSQPDMDRLLLVLFLLSYGVTILLNRDQNLSANIKEWLYMAVVFLVLFRTDEEPQAVFSDLKRLMGCFLIFSFGLSVVCLVTFLFSLNGHATYNGQWVYYGMFENRLWGLYNPNTGSAINTISILMGLGVLLFCDRGKKNRKQTLVRIFLIANLFLQYICLLLTNSRTAFYALLVGGSMQVLLYAGYMAPRRMAGETGDCSDRGIAGCVEGSSDRRGTRSKNSCRAKQGKFAGTGRLWRYGRYAILCVAVCLILSGTATPIRNVLAGIPDMVSAVETALFGTQGGTADDTEESATGTAASGDSLTRMEELEERPGGFLNGRLELWTAGWETFLESPLFGIGFENIALRVQENLEDEYWLNDLTRGGIHSSYLSILLSSGIVGAVLFVAFLIRLMVGSLRYVFSGRMCQEHGLVICLLSVAAVQLLMECFESRLLYQVNIFYLLFWCTAGYLEYYIRKAVLPVHDE